MKNFKIDNTIINLETVTFVSIVDQEMYEGFGYAIEFNFIGGTKERFCYTMKKEEIEQKFNEIFLTMNDIL